MVGARQDAAAQVAILQTAYEELKQEFDRIEKMFKYSGSKLLAEYLRKIGVAFDERIKTARDQLLEIRKQIDSGVPVEFEKAWEHYVKLRTEVLPPLANELLAVIGGAYLQQESLDSMRSPLTQGPGASTGDVLSFSTQSQQLVGILNENSRFGWESVLIVGEEYLGHSEAEIIRLRFPACDLWHLPFTAHEYGYLVATNPKKAPEDFTTLRDRVKALVDPANHADGKKPADAACFIDEVHPLWERYHALKTDEDREQFKMLEQSTIRQLQEQQDNYLCRLFADAIATLFIGPAYVHALLHLRFVPERFAKPSPYFPPFVLRFVVALEMLTWMSRELTSDSSLEELLIKHDMPPFRREIFNDGTSDDGLAGLWRLTLRSANQGDTYGTTFNKYQPWIKLLPTFLRTKRTGLNHTYESWKVARDLESRLCKPVLSVPYKPSKLAILNAAWSARWLYPRDLETITEFALKLLDPNEEQNWYRIEEEPASQAGILNVQKGSEVEADSPRTKAVGAVIEFLAAPEHEKVLNRFTEMLEKQGAVKQDVVLMQTLKGDALRQYIWLYQNPDA